jgi:hypothetical protein
MAMTPVMIVIKSTAANLFTREFISLLLGKIVSGLRVRISPLLSNDYRVVKFLISFTGSLSDYNAQLSLSLTPPLELMWREI